VALFGGIDEGARAQHGDLLTLSYYFTVLDSHIDARAHSRALTAATTTPQPFAAPSSR
jgi:hypothetical protein